MSFELKIGREQLQGRIYDHLRRAMRDWASGETMTSQKIDEIAWSMVDFFSNLQSNTMDSNVVDESKTGRTFLDALREID